VSEKKRWTAIQNEDEEVHKSLMLPAGLEDDDTFNLIL